MTILTQSGATFAHFEAWTYHIPMSQCVLQRGPWPFEGLRGCSKSTYISAMPPFNLTCMFSVYFTKIVISSTNLAELGKEFQFFKNTKEKPPKIFCNQQFT